MIHTLLLTLTAFSPLPIPLTNAQKSDIGCVAAIAIIADEQKRDVAYARRFADVQSAGRIWAGIVGDRITSASGQPREVIAFAFRQAAMDERRVLLTPPARMERAVQCIAQMQTELMKEKQIQ
jgi:hypothetical protein